VTALSVDGEVASSIEGDGTVTERSGTSTEGGKRGFGQTEVRDQVPGSLNLNVRGG